MVHEGGQIELHLGGDRDPLHRAQQADQRGGDHMRVEVVGWGLAFLGDHRGELLLPLAHPVADARLDGRGGADDARRCPFLL